MSTLREDRESKNSFLGVPSQAGPGNPCHPSENPAVASYLAQSENSNRLEVEKAQMEVSALKDAAVRLTKKLDAWRELGRQSGADMEYWFKLSGGEYPRRRLGEIRKAIEDAERL